MTELKKTIEAVTVILTAANKVDAAISDDGKISLSEGIGIAMTSIGLVSVFKNIGDIAIELKGITQESLNELIAFFKEKFDLKNDEAELMVEQSLEVLLRLALVVFGKKAIAVAKPDVPA